MTRPRPIPLAPLFLLAIVLWLWGTWQASSQTITGATINGKPLRLYSVGTTKPVAGYPSRPAPTLRGPIRYRITGANWSPLQLAKIRGAFRAAGATEASGGSAPNVTIAKTLLPGSLRGTCAPGAPWRITINALHDLNTSWSFADTVRHEIRHLREGHFHP